MRLDIDILKNKKHNKLDEIFSLSVEYLLSSVSKEYFKLNNYSSLAEFNEKNQLSFSKILLYPFFISLSNGHSRSLFHLFGEFYPMSFGPISVHVFRLISGSSNSKLNYFDAKYFDPNSIGIRVLDTSLKDFDNIKDLIREQEVSFEGEMVKFKELTILSDSNNEREIYKAIESGVKAIQEQSQYGFFNADLESIMLHASYFKAFKDRYDANKLTSITYEEIEAGKSRPFYLEEGVG